MEAVLVIALTDHRQVDRVAPLPPRRLTPVNSAVSLLDCWEGAAIFGGTSPIRSAGLKGQLATRGGGVYSPHDPPAVRVAVVTTGQNYVLILMQLC